MRRIISLASLLLALFHASVFHCRGPFFNGEPVDRVIDFLEAALQ